MPSTKPAGGTTHGLCGHELYATWKSMLERCRNPHRPKYANYGGRGIRVCERFIMAAEDHRGHPALTLRTDSRGAVAPRQGNAQSALRIQAQRERLRAVLASQWRLTWVARGSNLSAHALARSARFIGERVLV